jgi:D-glycero-alpha-D-manno-heptose-7-phosphate kinase
MIISRAPLRVSFVGGGTDLPDFYHRYPGRVISAAIDKFVYVVVNRTPFIHKVSARYSISETVDFPHELKHTRIKAALVDIGIEKNIEIASFAHLPAKTGLGSSSSFSVALMKGLYAFVGKKIDKSEVAEAASRLEIELVGEPIGKQDQYAAAFGGFNVIQFNQDDTVTVEPVLLDFKKQLGLESHLLLFFTGIMRVASSVLTEQKANVGKNFDTLKTMADSVPECKTRLLAGDFKGLGDMLHQGWRKKKSLASNVSTGAIDELYEAGMNAGAWGGKVLGAGGGGCVMFLAPEDRKSSVRAAVQKVAAANNLSEFQEIPVKFVQSGAEILFNGDKHHAALS